MIHSNGPTRDDLLLLVAGIKGAVGSTLAAAVAAWPSRPQLIRPYLTIDDYFPRQLDGLRLHAAGWDCRPEPLAEVVASQGVVPQSLLDDLRPSLEDLPVAPAPDRSDMAAAVDRIVADIQRFRQLRPGAPAVLVNLLPACPCPDQWASFSLERLREQTDARQFPDLAYMLAALECELPVVNFTPNELELPAVCREARRRDVPICGRDGKTGQTYFKVVLASALKARRLEVDGWYSLNILGNADGANLMDPSRAAGKLANKTELLDEVLGYPVGRRHGTSTHTVRIDYYPPRGDAKEAWDVIDFQGLFDLPMGLRVNLQGRDSILAAPMALDLAFWLERIRRTGRGGPVGDLAFYFKRPLGERPALTFERQLAALDRLAGQLGAPQ